MIAVKWIDLAEFFDGLAEKTAQTDTQVSAAFRQAALNARENHKRAMERGDYEDGDE